MARLIIRVDGSFSGPKVDTDPRLSNGSLVLVDPAHPQSGWSLEDTTLTNIAADQLASQIGSSAGTSALTINNTMSEDTGQVEATEKGGIHFIINQNGSVEGERWHAEVTTAIRNYIDGRLDAGDALYISWWARITRAMVWANVSSAHGLVGVLPTASYTSYIGPVISENTGNITTSPTSPSLGRTTAALSNGEGLFRADIGHAANPSTSNPALIRAGNVTSNFPKDNAPSWILYAFCIENLTASGRTYDEASAADAEAYAAAFAPGGRYYDDSWTDPETVYPTL